MLVAVRHTASWEPVDWIYHGFAFSGQIPHRDVAYIGILLLLINFLSLPPSLSLDAALTLQFVTHTFQEDHDPTIGEELAWYLLCVKVCCGFSATFLSVLATYSY